MLHIEIKDKPHRLLHSTCTETLGLGNPVSRSLPAAKDTSFHYNSFCITRPNFKANLNFQRKMFLVMSDCKGYCYKLRALLSRVQSPSIFWTSEVCVADSNIPQCLPLSHFMRWVNFLFWYPVLKSYPPEKHGGKTIISKLNKAIIIPLGMMFWVIYWLLKIRTHDLVF